MALTDRPAHRPRAAGGPSFPAYERLLQGRGKVSLRAIMVENPMLRFAIARQLELGSVAVAGLTIDHVTGALLDIWLRLSTTWSPIDALG